jgi:hypothetical protein
MRRCGTREGWRTGIEPATTGITTPPGAVSLRPLRGSKPLSRTHEACKSGEVGRRTVEDGGARTALAARPPDQPPYFVPNR